MWRCRRGRFKLGGDCSVDLSGDAQMSWMRCSGLARAADSNAQPRFVCPLAARCRLTARPLRRGRAPMCATSLDDAVMLRGAIRRQCEGWSEWQTAPRSEPSHCSLCCQVRLHTRGNRGEGSPGEASRGTAFLHSPAASPHPVWRRPCTGVGCSSAACLAAACFVRSHTARLCAHSADRRRCIDTIRRTMAEH